MGRALAGGIGTVPDYVSVAYRGATYALGQGPQSYAIWYAAALQAQPLESWPLTPEGWTAAWSKFVSVEVPGSITPVAPAASGPVSGPVSPMTGPVGPVASSTATGAPPGGAVAGPGGFVTGPDAAYGASPSVAGAPGLAGSWTSPGPNARPEPSPGVLIRNSRIAAVLLAVGLLLGI